jgi:hypothetical protein
VEEIKVSAQQHHQTITNLKLSELCDKQVRREYSYSSRRSAALAKQNQKNEYLDTIARENYSKAMETIKLKCRHE